jgi:hypothetical protein
MRLQVPPVLAVEPAAEPSPRLLAAACVAALVLACAAVYRSERPLRPRRSTSIGEARAALTRDGFISRELASEAAHRSVSVDDLVTNAVVCYLAALDNEPLAPRLRGLQQHLR